jgi:hypothetical protein
MDGISRLDVVSLDLGRAPAIVPQRGRAIHYIPPHYVMS